VLQCVAGIFGNETVVNCCCFSRYPSLMKLFFPLYTYTFAQNVDIALSDFFVYSCLRIWVVKIACLNDLCVYVHTNKVG